MTQEIIIENGHKYLITKDDNGNIISQAACDDTFVVNMTKIALSKYAFRSLLTFQEKMLIDGYETNTSLSNEQKAAIRTFMIDFSISESIDLTDKNLIEGVKSLETFGLLAEGRANIILGISN